MWSYDKILFLCSLYRARHTVRQNCLRCFPIRLETPYFGPKVI